MERLFCGEDSEVKKKRNTSVTSTGALITSLELDSDLMILRKCWTCDTDIQCSTKAIEIPGLGMGVWIVPKYNAPMICKVCRADPKKFREARKAMYKYFGWGESTTMPIPTSEL